MGDWYLIPLLLLEQARPIVTSLTRENGLLVDLIVKDAIRGELLRLHEFSRFESRRLSFLKVVHERAFPSLSKVLVRRAKTNPMNVRTRQLTKVVFNL